MSVFKIEGDGEDRGRKLFVAGDLMPAEIYTASLPPGLATGKYSARMIDFSPRTEKGFVISGLIEFQKQGLLLFNTDPEQALEDMEKLKDLLANLGVDADPKENVLGNVERVEITAAQFEQRGSLRLLMPYQKPNPVLVTLSMLQTSRTLRKSNKR